MGIWKFMCCERDDGDSRAIGRSTWNVVAGHQLEHNEEYEDDDDSECASFGEARISVWGHWFKQTDTKATRISGRALS